MKTTAKQFDNCRLSDISYPSTLVVWALRRALNESDAGEMMWRTFAHILDEEKLGPTMAAFEQMVAGLRRGARAALDVREVEDAMVSNHEATVLAILAAYQGDAARQASWLIDSLVHRCARSAFAGGAYGFAIALAAADFKLPPDGRRAPKRIETQPSPGRTDDREEDSENRSGLAFLTAGELMIVNGIRLWVHVLKRNGDRLAMLQSHFAHHAMPDAALSLDAILEHSRLSATRSIDIRCRTCKGLSPDEARLLHAVALLQRNDPVTAAALLSSWLPPRVVSLTLPAVQGLAQTLTAAYTRLPLREWNFDGNATAANDADRAAPPEQKSPVTLH